MLESIGKLSICNTSYYKYNSKKYYHYCEKVYELELWFLMLVEKILEAKSEHPVGDEKCWNEKEEVHIEFISYPTLLEVVTQTCSLPFHRSSSHCD